MLLLTYDPNVKKTPDYVASLVSPYGGEKRFEQLRMEMLYAFLLPLCLMLPRAEQQ
jgi:hypothetical protein